MSHPDDPAQIVIQNLLALSIRTDALIRRLQDPEAPLEVLVHQLLSLAQEAFLLTQEALALDQQASAVQAIHASGQEIQELIRRVHVVMLEGERQHRAGAILGRRRAAPDDIDEEEEHPLRRVRQRLFYHPDQNVEEVNSSEATSEESPAAKGG